MRTHVPKGHSLTKLDFELLRLPGGEKKEWRSPEYETVAVLIEGECVLTVDGIARTFRRSSVFTDSASSVFISPGILLTIETRLPTIIALCKARATQKHPTVFVEPSMVKREWRGREGYRRQVSNIVNTETATERIAVGETVSEPGQWSSFPPHKHDTRVEENGVVVEVPLEEIYYFRTEPKEAVAFHHLYDAQGAFNQVHPIKDHDVTHIPRGYHPVAAAPGQRVYYLWMLAGDERRYIWNTDPTYRSMEGLEKSWYVRSTNPMAHTWSRKEALDTLTAQGEGNLLVFEAPGERAEVHLKDGTIDKVIFTAARGTPVTVTAKDAHSIVVGEGNTARDVYHYLKPGGPAPTMRLGITRHRGEGTWSSLPHDFELNLEPGFEEIFFHLLTGGSERGIQVGKGVWCDNSPVHDVWPISDRTFSTVPMGYHPVVGEPGVHVSYIWVYLAKKKEWEKVK